MRHAWIIIVLCAGFSTSLLAQQGPPRDRPERRPGASAGGEEIGPGPGNPGGGKPGIGPGGPGNPGGAVRPGPLHPMVAQVESLRAWIEMVDRYTRLARDPSTAGVAAVIGANDLLRAKPETGIDYFTKLLSEVKNDAVHRAIRLQLIELYTKTGQQDKALEQLRHLMISAPPGSPTTTVESR